MEIISNINMILLVWLVMMLFGMLMMCMYVFIHDRKDKAVTQYKKKKKMGFVILYNTVCFVFVDIWRKDGKGQSNSQRL